MARMQSQFDWRVIRAPRDADQSEVDPRRRLRVLFVGFLFGIGLVWMRMLQLEVVHGDGFRAAAARPLERKIVIKAPRGRILARDGSILAEDVAQLALAVHYRYVQTPPHEAWLRARARRALAPEQRRDRQAVAREMQNQRAELDAMRARLADLAGVSLEDWNRRCGEIQASVERIAGSVRRRQERRWLETSTDEPAIAADDWRARLAQWLSAPSDAPPRFEAITVAEELAEHVVVDQIALAVMVEIEAHPDLWPGVRVVERRRRTYPAAQCAAHVVGYVRDEGPDALASAATDPDGVRGIERQYDTPLRGQDGLLVERSDSTGRVLETVVERPVVPGQDVTLTLDSNLQRATERLLDAALARRIQLSTSASPEPAGGAAVVLDTRTGAVLAMATAPRFDPNLFATSDAAAVAALMSDVAAPLVDRPTQMAIPPGSVFKLVSGAALLADPGFDPRELLTCRGYVEQPDRLRCALFVRQGVGHGPVDLVAALARSCNVYFFAHGRTLGGDALAAGARRFGLGAATGIDLPGEAAGNVPRTELGAPGRATGWSQADTEALSIGQSTLTTTPLQIARLMAALANEGRLVTPHLVRGLGVQRADNATIEIDAGASDSNVDQQRVAGLDARALAILREGMKEAVRDPHGSAHAAFAQLPVAVAGKTGTAQVGAGREDHAWFAGYAPADRPKVAIVVALEHAGDGGVSAAPLARRIVERLIELGYVPAGARAAPTTATRDTDLRRK